MQKHDPAPDFTEVTPVARISAATHGWRAKCLQRLIRLDLPVPATVALPAATVQAIAQGQPFDTTAILARFRRCAAGVRSPSPENPTGAAPPPC